jgi:heme/copper-type cytochrome/quinol oxidase subunit 2
MKGKNMKKVALIFLFVLVALSACAPNAEAISANNASPEAISNAQAKDLKAISDFMDAAAARERAQRPDYSWIWAMVFTGFIFAGLLGTVILAVILARRAQTQQGGDTRVVNNYFMVSPRGHVFPLSAEKNRIEAGHEVTALLEMAKREITRR